MLTATSAKKGLELARRHNPRLIISDVLMPQMNGYEFCKILKEDVSTCHIPVVLLTARTTHEDKIEGFNMGADAYITKPFHFSLLQSRVSSLILNRKRTMERFKVTPLTKDIAIDFTAIDQQILEKAIRVVEDNLENPDFNLTMFVEKMEMTNSMLYRKIKSLTNLSPMEFIKNVRLKAAARLLLEKKVYVSEIAYKVGFNDPRYFSNCFRKEFHMTPREYIQHNTGTTSGKEG